MAAINATSRRPASRSAGKIAQKAAGFAPMAHNVSRAPASRSGARFYTPSELAGALTEAGLPASERSIVRRCHLPAGHALRIESNPNFGRIYIPAAELARLLGQTTEGAA